MENKSKLFNISNFSNFFVHFVIRISSFSEKLNSGTLYDVREDLVLFKMIF